MSSTEYCAASGADNFHPDEKLLGILDTLRQNISDGKYSKDIQTEILESIEGYVTGKGVQLDPQIVKYLVAGWWVQDAMEKIKSDLNPGESLICPLCFQKKIDLEISNDIVNNVKLERQKVD
uniref:Uncharacterized protein n=1 Tax=Marseillevirus LCMAC101 TaxID=2506602 RepID=A0A481YQV5_9VIRU|nr:MAG: hypothetical protein LCMAC101_01450 [Marseillevirus LCMAC101]